MSDVSKETLKKEIAGNYASFVWFFRARALRVRRYWLARVPGRFLSFRVYYSRFIVRARARPCSLYSPNGVIGSRGTLVRVQNAVSPRCLFPYKWPPPPVIAISVVGAPVRARSADHSTGPRFPSSFSSDFPVGRFPASRARACVFRSSSAYSDSTINDARPRPVDGAPRPVL